MYLYTHTYIQWTIKKGILPFATTWVNLEDIVSSEISEKQKDKYYVIPARSGSKTEAERTAAAGAGGRGN